MVWKTKNLSCPERKFKYLIKIHLGNLLESKRIYWKQRNIARWVVFGDENTKLFQAMAIYFRRKYISELHLSDGSILKDHDKKSRALWLAYKGRLGVSEFTKILYDLSTLLQQELLPDLDGPFTIEEIDAVLKDMPMDHAPGLDGFNGVFIKKCWLLIRDDFIRLCRDFHSGNPDISSINGSLITLIPKKDHPQTVNDYRPISFLNYSLKFLTKLLANRLQHIILQVVHSNQYGFIKGRTIQDCLGTT